MVAGHSKPAHTVLSHAWREDVENPEHEFDGWLVDEVLRYYDWPDDVPEDAVLKAYRDEFGSLTVTMEWRRRINPPVPTSDPANG